MCVCVCDYTGAAARAFILQDRRDTVKHRECVCVCVCVCECVTIRVPLRELLSCRTEEIQLNTERVCVCVCVCVCVSILVPLRELLSCRTEEIQLNTESVCVCVCVCLYWCRCESFYPAGQKRYS